MRGALPPGDRRSGRAVVGLLGLLALAATCAGCACAAETGDRPLDAVADVRSSDLDLRDRGSDDPGVADGGGLQDLGPADLAGDGGDPAPDPGIDIPYADAPEPLPALAWTDLGLHPLDDQGASTIVQVPFAGGLRYLAIRATPGDGTRSRAACFRLEPVSLASGALWVDEPCCQAPMTPVCTSCTQRVYSGNGYGFFVFPNDGRPLEGPDTLHFRVQMRHCATGVLATRALVPDLPATVRVELATEAALTAAIPAGLDVRVAVDPAVALAPATWDEAWATVTELYAKAGIAPHLSRFAALPAPRATPLRYDPGDPTELDEAYRGALEVLSDGPADTRFLPVILVSCLDALDPVTQGTKSIAGHCSRIPGGAPAGGSASAVFVAISRCGGLPPAWSSGRSLGVLIAHEMGHYLGLYHADTEAAAHRAPVPAANVMQSSVPGIDAQAADWSEAQRDVMGRHPDVVGCSPIARANAWGFPRAGD